MAEDLRDQDPAQRLIEAKRAEIIKECHRQAESCLYTSTMLYAWLRQVRRQKQWFVALPIVLGGAAGITVLNDYLPDYAIALLAFSASLFPALADGLQIQTSVDEISRLAAEFKALQDRFRRVAKITALGDVADAEAALSDLMDRMDLARSASITPPEKYFRQAKAKIDAGHYNFDVDLQLLKESEKARQP
jgi:hypothetical protein